MDSWSRRNFVLTAAGLIVAGAGVGATWYFNARSDERHARDFPAPVGDGIKICEAVVGEYVPMWTRAFVSSELMRPQDFTYGAKRSEIFRTFFHRGGSWYGRLRVEITVESQRRTVLINGMHVKVRSLGSPPKGTIFVPLPYGGAEGPGEETEKPRAGVNLDAPRPVVRSRNETTNPPNLSSSQVGGSLIAPNELVISLRLLRVLNPAMFGSLETLEEQANVRDKPLMLGDIFPERQITLGPHDEKQMTIIAEARTGYYEWELFFDVIADGERQIIPVKITNDFPLRLAAPVKGYSVALQEMYHPDNADDVFGGVRAIGMEELLGAFKMS